MRAFRAQLAALFAALVLVLPGAVWARAHYLCRMTGRPMPASCCNEHAGESREKRALPLDCCRRVTPAAHTGTPGTRFASQDLAPAALANVLAEPAYLPLHSLAVERAPRRARAPPPAGPPLYLAHCSFLS